MSLTSGEGAVPFTMPVQPAYSGNGGNNGGNNGWGGDSAWWIIILFLFVFCGWGNGGFGGYGNGGMNGAATQGALTREQACIDNNFQNLMRETAGISDAVNLGFSNLNSTVCSQQYDTARMINGLQGTVQAGFNASNIAQLQGQNALATQIAGCCCDAQQTMAGINYNLSTQSCDTRNTIQNGLRDVIENQNANANAIINKLTQQEIEAKNAQITALNQQLFGAQLAASQTAQNQYLLNQLKPCPIPAYLTCSPYTTYNVAPVSLNGCNSGCGCGGYSVAA